MCLLFKQERSGVELLGRLLVVPARGAQEKSHPLNPPGPGPRAGQCLFRNQSNVVLPLIVINSLQWLRRILGLNLSLLTAWWVEKLTSKLFLKVTLLVTQTFHFQLLPYCCTCTSHPQLACYRRASPEKEWVVSKLDIPSRADSSRFPALPFISDMLLDKSNLSAVILRVKSSQSSFYEEFVKFWRAKQLSFLFNVAHPVQKHELFFLFGNCIWSPETMTLSMENVNVERWM